MGNHFRERETQKGVLLLLQVVFCSLLNLAFYFVWSIHLTTLIQLIFLIFFLTFLLLFSCFLCSFFCNKVGTYTFIFSLSLLSDLFAFSRGTPFLFFPPLHYLTIFCVCSKSLLSPSKTSLVSSPLSHDIHHITLVSISKSSLCSLLVSRRAPPRAGLNTRTSPWEWIALAHLVQSR